MFPRDEEHSQSGIFTPAFGIQRGEGTMGKTASASNSRPVCTNTWNRGDK